MTQYRTDREELARRRRALGESQREFALACGLTKSVIAKAESKTESGGRSLTVSQLVTVADRLGIDPRDLLVEDTRPEAGKRRSVAS